MFVQQNLVSSALTPYSKPLGKRLTASSKTSFRKYNHKEVPKYMEFCETCVSKKHQDTAASDGGMTLCGSGTAYVAYERSRLAAIQV